jgi:hypothetical protein
MSTTQSISSRVAAGECLHDIYTTADAATRAAIDRLLGRPATGDPYGRLADLIAAGE